ncbi:hypothetical protein [Thalassobaculum sp.]|jgi:hypothetical protein|uniref:hypothetical protein n=1 Tax=Thalassobaculum sp. TaxID=2022740 RepID=UPI003B592D2B
MTRNRTRAALLGAIIPAFLLGACVNNPFGSGFAATDERVTAISGNQQDPSDGPINRFAQFDDIPIPVDAEMDLGQTLILGSAEGWIGRLSLDTGYGMTDMYAFYEQEMPRFGWEQVTTVRARISTMTYQRGPRIATITLQPTMTRGTLVDFTVAPARTQGGVPIPPPRS